MPNTSIERRPEWLVKRLPAHVETPVPGLLEDLHLNTVCRSARCPNLSECWARRTATFMILGEACTRDCRFCAVWHASTGLGTDREPEPVSETEPARVAEAARRLGLRFVVVTSVTRDDLPDGGAAHFANAIIRLRESNPTLKIEVLAPDFKGSPDSIKILAVARPDIVNHNLETVPLLYPIVRPGAIYKRSLRLLKQVKELDEHINFTLKVRFRKSDDIRRFFHKTSDSGNTRKVIIVLGSNPYFLMGAGSSVAT